MAQSGDPVSNAKAALASANKAFPSPAKAPAPKAQPAAPVVHPPTVGDELKAKADNVNQYMNAPKMHKGGPVMADGVYTLRAGEHVLAKGEADKARKHALMASGVKSLAMPGKTAKPKAPAGDNNSMTVEGANVVDKTEPPGKIPPAPRSPLKQDDAYQKQRVSTI